MGFSVDSDHHSNIVVACSPLWKNNEACADLLKTPSRPNGICYLIYDNHYPAESSAKIHPLTNCDSQKMDDYYFAYSEFGASMQIVQNMSEIIVGAPGVLQWKGAVLRYRFLSGTIDCSCSSTTSLRQNNYLGYSSSYGKFTSVGDISYVTTAPRAAGNKGKVFVFNFEDNWNVLKQREGTQFGEYFGAAICVGDFNNDGLDDLLVGAPQHSIRESAGDEGCVYILISTEEGWKTWKDGDKGMIFGSQQINARFGTAIALLGDINMDGYPDVAIGAPYENKRGAIYIYHGSRSGLNSHYTQRVTPSESSNLRGFGFSISRGFDIDGNLINDVAVGTYISGHVVVLKTYPVVTITPKLIPDGEKIPFASQGFTRMLCLSYLEKYVGVNVEVEISIKVDQRYRRAFFNTSNTGKLTDTFVNRTILRNSKAICHNLSLVIKNQTQFSNSIEFLMGYKIVSPVASPYESSFIKERKSNEFCKDCVVRNPQSPQHAKWNVHYVPDSSPADLNIKANFINVTVPYTVGSTKSIQFGVKLRNTNERAIDPKILVKVPLKHLKIPPLCQTVVDTVNDIPGDTSELICDVMSPFVRGNEFTINFTLATSAMPPKATELEICVEAYSRNLEKNISDNIYCLHLPLSRTYQLEIHGRSEEYVVISGSENRPISKEQEVMSQKLYKHSFKILNYGPSPATDVHLFFEIPHKILILGVAVEVLNVVEYAAYLEEQPLLCSSQANFSSTSYSKIPALEETQLPANRTYILSCSSQTVQCIKHKCSVQYLDAIGYGVHVSLILKLNTKKLGISMGLKDIILIQTFGYITSPYELHAEAHSIVWTTLQDTSIDAGVLALSIGFGCFILLVCLLLLIKLGFFRRQDAIERYYRQKTAIALQTNNIPASRFYSQRGSIMVF